MSEIPILCLQRRSFCTVWVSFFRSQFVRIRLITVSTKAIHVCMFSFSLKKNCPINAAISMLLAGTLSMTELTLITSRHLSINRLLTAFITPISRPHKRSLDVKRNTFLSRASRKTLQANAAINMIHKNKSCACGGVAAVNCVQKCNHTAAECQQKQHNDVRNLNASHAFEHFNHAEHQKDNAD